MAFTLFCTVGSKLEVLSYLSILGVEEEEEEGVPGLLLLLLSSKVKEHGLMIVVCSVEKRRGVKGVVKEEELGCFVGLVAAWFCEEEEGCCGVVEEEEGVGLGASAVLEENSMVELLLDLARFEGEGKGAVLGCSAWCTVELLLYVVLW